MAPPTSTTASPLPSALPKTHRALVLTSRTSPLTIEHRPTPTPTPGSAIIQVLASVVLSYAGEAYTGARPYAFVTPLVPGTSAVGRVVAVGPDSTALKPGQLVFADSIIRSRDEPEHIILQGLVYNGPGAVKLMDGEWRDGTYAEYAKQPLESLYPLNEERLLGPISDGGLGLSISQLAGAFQPLVTFGGLDDINLRPGEVVIVCPATGPFGSAAVSVAIAMGARVIAMGRNAEVLHALAASCPPGGVIPVPLTTDAQADADAVKAAAGGAPIDAFFDISPQMASGSHHLVTCINALRHGARVSLMGGITDEVPLPYRSIMRRNITVRGTWMYTREQALRFVKLIENGNLNLSMTDVVGEFGLHEWKEAFECAQENGKPGRVAVVVPWKSE